MRGAYTNKEIVGNLDSKYLNVVSVADGNPIRLGGGPLHLVDLSLCSIGQNGDLNWLGHWLDIPDQGLVVISYRKGQVQVNTRGFPSIHRNMVT